MIANFFQSLKEHQAQYLLISGQATVLYGAATFSEDIDLWIHPTEDNRRRFLACLRECRARYYKLTPSLTVENLEFGHGFHFLLPGEGDDMVFLDVMGNPPRVPVFSAAQPSAQLIETEWGTIPTIGIKHLVDLKKTQRLEDYPIIGRLVLSWLDQLQIAKDSLDLDWALHNIFTLPELVRCFTDHPETVALANRLGRETIENLAEFVSTGREITESLESEVSAFLHGRIAELQAADRHYWRAIITQLKSLRSNGELMEEGEEVSTEV